MTNTLPTTYPASQLLFQLECESLIDTPIAKKLKLPEQLINDEIEIPSELLPNHPLFEKLKKVIQKIDQQILENPQNATALDRIRKFYYTYIYKACSPKVSSENSVSLFHTFENSAQICAYARASSSVLSTVYKETPNHPEQIRCFNKMAEAYLENGHTGEALRHAKMAYQLNFDRGEASWLLDEFVSSFSIAAAASFKEEKPDVALEYYRIAESYLTQINQHPDAHLATLYEEYASIYDSQSNQEMTLKYILEANAIIERLYGSNSLALAVSLSKSGVYHSKYGKKAPAQNCMSKALEIFQQYRPDQLEPNVVVSLYNMAKIYQELRQDDKTLKCLEKALDILLNKHPTEIPAKGASVLKKLVCLYKQRRAYELALNCSIIGLELEKKLHNNQLLHPKIASAHRRLALAYLDLKDFQNAYMNLLTAYNILVPMNRSEDKSDLVDLLNDFGTYYNTLGSSYIQNSPLAAQSFRNGINCSIQALQIGNTLPQPAGHTAITLNNLAEATLYVSERPGKQECEMAERYATQALKINRERYGDRAHFQTTKALYLLSQISQKLEKPQLAKEYLQQASKMAKKL